MLMICLLLTLYLFNFEFVLIFYFLKLSYKINTSSISTMRKIFAFEIFTIYTHIDAFWPNTLVKGNGLMVLSCSVMWETRSIICLKLAAAVGRLQQPGRQTVVFPPLLEWRWRADRADWADTATSISQNCRHKIPASSKKWIQIHQHHQPHFITNSYIIWNRSRYLDTEKHLFRIWKKLRIKLKKSLDIYMYLSNNIVETETWSCVLIYLDICTNPDNDITLLDITGQP